MTKSLSKGSVLKSGWMYINPTEARVIDTNAMVESKLKELSFKLAAETEGDAGFTEGFVQGIKAEQVTELIGEGLEPISEEAENAIPESELLLQQAQEEIENMKAQALAEIEEARVQVIEEAKKIGYQEGFALGEKEGYEKGHVDGLNSVAEEREEALREVSIQLAQMEEAYQNKIAELEPQFIETLTGIYEHIFHVSLKNSRDLIVYLIENTMRNLEGSNGFLIHVSREDYPFVSMQKKELVKGTGISVDDIDIIEDATLARSECMIETGNGVFDCGLGTQLEALNEELRLLSYEPGKTEG
ncbi:MAG: hypothetical protein II273_02620 [Lachnospiraceae bacterium]|nr:hypothetical protein [Lachnospiraceae bacterium]MEE1255188.1 FliH/SctL family protein [Lachnospiraceae bacterium]